MKNFYRFVIAISILTAFLGAISCDKAADEISDVSFDSVQDVAVTEANLNLIYADMFNLGIRGGAFADVTIDPPVIGKTDMANGEDIWGGSMTIKYVGSSSDPFGDYYVVVDFGIDNRLGVDGVNRRGGLVLHFKGRWGQVGSTMEVIFGIIENNVVIREGYFINDNKVDGDVLIECLGSNSFKRVISNGKVTFPDATFATRNSNITTTWKSGQSTPLDLSDDSYSFYGSIEGVTSKEVAYTINVPSDSPIVKNATCAYPVTGISELQIKRIKFALDYGYENGACDAIAQLDFYGVKKIINF